MYVGRCIFVAITAYLLYNFWKVAWRGPESGTGTGAVSLSAYALLAREIFIRCEWVSLALTVVAAVIAGSDMIGREIRNGTLGLLFLTTLTPTRVVLGKWKGAWSSIEALDPITVLDSFDIGRYRYRDIPAVAVERVLRFFSIYLPVTLALPAEMVLRFRRIAIQA
jgi:ABC-type transport system involved in multi-copper enzyme maturation permease subunit